MGIAWNCYTHIFNNLLSKKDFFHDPTKLEILKTSSSILKKTFDTH